MDYTYQRFFIVVANDIKRRNDRFNKLYSSVGMSTGGSLNESIRLAGTLLTILPLIVLYFVVQKQFVESIERTGLTGE